jgi:hypothetical protein
VDQPHDRQPASLPGEEQPKEEQPASGRIEDQPDEQAPEFLNPESPRYQPWAEKRIFNAIKEKRPLQEFMAEFDSRVTAYGDLSPGSWDPQHNDRLLARFTSPASGPRRRRRRRPGGGGPSSAQRAPTATANPGPRAGVKPPAPTSPAPAAGAERHRRRRRRPRGARRPPEAGAGE